MYKRIILIILVMSLFTVAQGQSVEWKKCKKCGKPLKECSYNGKHPQQETPAKPTVGVLSITSSPSGVAVKVNGKYKGETPVTLKKQSPGIYTVNFSAEGYESTTKSVRVTTGERTACHASLKKENHSTTADRKISMEDNTLWFSIDGQKFCYRMLYVNRGSTGNFYIGETEVTQALWQAVMKSNPSYFKGLNLPVEQVSWDDCKDFIRKLNAITGENFRLPKESEWEYAAKGGNKSKGYAYSGSMNIDDVAWYWKNSGDRYLSGTDYDLNWDKISKNNSQTHLVKQKQPNELGIYDMSGNVWEWCEDLYDSSTPNRVNRGGSWHNEARNCRVTIRDSSTPSYYDNALGFRLAR